MRKLKLYIAASLDGKIARPDGAIDWLPDPTTGGDDYSYGEFMNSVDSTVMGYKTYEVCVGFGEWPYPDKASYVFSRDPQKSVIPQAQLITENPTAFVQELKQSEGKDIWLLGGGEVVTLLHDAGLVDEYIIAIIPVILGAGIELFPNVRQQANLRLSSHRVYENGLALLYYERAV